MTAPTPTELQKAKQGQPVIAYLYDPDTGAPVTPGAGDASAANQTALSAKIGEVQASPTANTVLDRLKALLTGIVLAAGSALIGKVDHSTTGIGSGVKSVTTAGTAVVLAASTAAKWVEMQAYLSNTGYVAIGASTVLAATGGEGIKLAAGERASYMCDNLNDFYVDSTVNGEGVRYIYGT